MPVRRTDTSLLSKAAKPTPSGLTDAIPKNLTAQHRLDEKIKGFEKQYGRFIKDQHTYRTQLFKFLTEVRKSYTDAIPKYKKIQEEIRWRFKYLYDWSEGESFEEDPMIDSDITVGGRRVRLQDILRQTPQFSYSSLKDTSADSYMFVGNVSNNWIRPEGLSSFSSAFTSPENEALLFDKRKKIQSRSRRNKSYVEYIRSIRSKLGKRFDDEARKRKFRFNEKSTVDENMTVESMPSITTYIINKRPLREKYAAIVKKDLEKKELAAVEAARSINLGDPVPIPSQAPSRIASRSLPSRLDSMSDSRADEYEDPFKAVLPPVR